MLPVQALILALVEGITEFLPVSSTGHLIVASRLLGIPQTEFVKSFEIVIQLGAILAVVWLYSKKITRNISWWLKIMTAFVPTAVVGLIFYKTIKTVLLGNMLVDIVSLFVGGVAIIALEKFFASRKLPFKSISQVNLKTSAGIGIFQSVSVIPGVSRAAATIFGGMGLGLTREAATEFSFLLAVPTMAAATGLDLLKTRFAFSTSEYGLMALGFSGAFLAALFTVRWLINFVSRHSFVGFGVYRIVAALIFYKLFL